MLGGELARALGVALGEKVTLIAPQGQVTPAGVVPRLKQFTVIGTFDSGHYEYDSALALLHIGDAQRLFRVDGPTGVRAEDRGHAARAGSRCAAREVAAAESAGARLDPPESAAGSRPCRWRSG